MKKRDKKSIQVKAKLYRRDYYNSPLRYFTDSFDLPKLKKRSFHPKEYGLYDTCPKWWNKLFHIRPFRRKNKHFCKVAATRSVDHVIRCSIACQGVVFVDVDWTEDGIIVDWEDCPNCLYDEIVYAYEGICEPSYRNFEYYT